MGSGAAPWWLGIGRAETRVECAGERHRIVWERGELLAPDHDDIDSERALVALGGEACECAGLLETWARHAADPQLLVIGSRGTSDPIPDQNRDAGQARAVARLRPRPGIAMTQRWLGGGASASMRMYGSSQVQPSPEEGAVSDVQRMVRMLALGGGIPRRLLAAVANGHRGGAIDAADPARPILHTALYGRLLGALATWLGPEAERLELAIIPEHDERSLLRRSDGSIEARVPFGWLVDVWGRGTEVFWDRFCLGASTVDGRVWELVTVGPDLGPPGLTRVELGS